MAAFSGWRCLLCTFSAKPSSPSARRRSFLPNAPHATALGVAMASETAEVADCAFDVALEAIAEMVCATWYGVEIGISYCTNRWMAA